ncbi:MAG: CYTH domain-containing protein [Candidatus Omnitrophica bacterium]|nr:CYTH domain-containing protein [Candidatus Omnitrophota bacterium]
MTAIEREARFLVEAPAIHRAVSRLVSLGPFRVVRRHRERQHNTYFDTADMRLWRAKSVLKLRETRAWREVTFKKSLGYRDGVASRLEVTSRLPDAQRIDLTQADARLEPMCRVQRLIGRQPLRKLFTVVTDRRTLILAHDRQRVELDLDRVAVRHHCRILARRLEIEVENLTATPSAFRSALAALRRRYGRHLRLSAVSKFEFGLQATTQSYDTLVAS